MHARTRASWDLRYRYVSLLFEGGEKQRKEGRKEGGKEGREEGRGVACGLFWYLMVMLMVMLILILILILFSWSPFCRTLLYLAIPCYALVW